MSDVLRETSQHAQRNVHAGVQVRMQEAQATQQGLMQIGDQVQRILQIRNEMKLRAAREEMLRREALQKMEFLQFEYAVRQQRAQTELLEAQTKKQVADYQQSQMKQKERLSLLQLPAVRDEKGQKARVIGFEEGGRPIMRPLTKEEVADDEATLKADTERARAEELRARARQRAATAPRAAPNVRGELDAVSNIGRTAAEISGSLGEGGEDLRRIAADTMRRALVRHKLPDFDVLLVEEDIEFLVAQGKAKTAAEALRLIERRAQQDSSYREAMKKK